MKRILGQQIIEIHRRLINQTGGMEGVRDSNMLDSAVMSPFQTFGGADLYPNLHAKAAQMGYQLINNHPFFDGNKRTGIHIMFLFLLINDEKIIATNKEKIELGLSIAEGKINPQEIILWLDAHAKKIR
ncbi:type II toxin-antitoxin system death-on-curing family toxin [Leadbettera azotonutricia]|uniref:Death on curing protein n=1 Tax=Leadbettera azotonutricia (strain ATCC BAA-888 / DSM 13862 / ZAS-9) TaxID=545695 RepID=F5YEY3_LEAAZ|nr:type II toxin-antitoxin system death-on-curing family toxin [Leadbettera azotonutricia]AEF81085.1 death on curing protein [Leadbettera azotonutricia ZAS-9]